MCRNVGPDDLHAGVPSFHDTLENSASIFIVIRKRKTNRAKSCDHLFLPAFQNLPAPSNTLYVDLYKFWVASGTSVPGNIVFLK